VKNLFQKFGLATSILALSLSSAASAHELEKPAPVQNVQVPNVQVPLSEVELDGPALWKVADEDTTIFLFGTVHALPEGVDWYKGSIADALGASDKLVTEIYLAPGSEMQAQAAFMSKGMLPEGESLRDMLSAEDKVTYEAAMTKLGLPAATFDRFEPWMAAVNMSMLPLLKAGYSPDTGVEKVLEANAEGKPRGELESIEFQVGVFDSLPLEAQIKFLMEGARGIDEIVPMLGNMVDEWIEGDPDGLALLMNEGFSDPALAEALLYSRNRNWAEWIDTRLDSPGTVFVAVGAGHLAGEKSVQDVLDTRGIKSIRIQ